MSMIGNCRCVSMEILAELLADPSRVPDFLYDENADPVDHLDLDKSWHAIHFLLNGETWEGTGPLFDAVLGGELLGEEDVGYGPARYLTPPRVREVANALAELPAEKLLERFNAETLNDAEVYPHGWAGERHELDYISQNYMGLVDFFRKVSNRGEAMLLYIN